MRGVGRQWCMELAIRGDHLTFANVLKLPRSKLCNWAANFLVHPRFGKPENALGVNFIHFVCEVCSHIYKKNKLQIQNCSNKEFAFILPFGKSENALGV